MIRTPLRRPQPCRRRNRNWSGGRRSRSRRNWSRSNRSRSGIFGGRGRKQRCRFGGDPPRPRIPIIHSGSVLHRTLSKTQKSKFIRRKHARDSWASTGGFAISAGLPKTCGPANRSACRLRQTQWWRCRPQSRLETCAGSRGATGGPACTASGLDYRAGTQFGTEGCKPPCIKFFGETTRANFFYGIGAVIRTSVPFNSGALPSKNISTQSAM